MGHMINLWGHIDEFWGKTNLLCSIYLNIMIKGDVMFLFHATTKNRKNKKVLGTSAQHQNYPDEVCTYVRPPHG